MTTEAAITITLKGDGSTPWIVLRADNADQAHTLLGEVYGGTQSLAEHAALASGTLTDTWAEERKKHTTPGQAVRTVAAAVGGTVQQQAPAQPAAGAGGNIETNKWGATFEWNHPKAPPTLHGPKVLKRATSRAGKPYAAWLDPRDPEIPSVYATNGSNKPADLIPSDYANGVG